MRPANFYLTLRCIGLAMLALFALPGIAEARGPACQKLFATAANKRTEADIKAAVADAYDRDGECLALAALSEVSLGQLERADAHASRAVTIDRASGLAQLAATAIRISVQGNRARQRGAPPADACDRTVLARQVQTLQMGAILTAAEGVPQLAVARLEDLGRMCVDDGSILFALQALCARAGVRSAALELLSGDMKRLGRIDVEHIPASGITSYALAAELQSSIAWKTEDWENNPPIATSAAPWVHAQAERGLNLLLADEPQALARLTTTSVLLALAMATADAVLLIDDAANAGRALADALFLGAHGGFAEPEIVNRLAPAAAGLWGLSLGKDEAAQVDKLLRLLEPTETSGAGAFASLLLRGAHATNTLLSPCQRASAIDAALTAYQSGLVKLPFSRWSPFVAKLASRGLDAVRQCESAGKVRDNLQVLVDAIQEGLIPPEWGERREYAEGSVVPAKTPTRRSR